MEIRNLKNGSSLRPDVTHWRHAGAEASVDASVAALSAAIASVGRDGFEKELCNLLQVTTRYVSVAIIAFSTQSKPRRLFDNLSCSDRKRALDPYLAGAYLLDPWYNMVGQEVPDGVYMLSEQAPDDFEQSEYFLHYYAQAGAHDECGMFVRTSSGVYIVISLALYREESRAALDLQKAQSLFPCIRALCLRHWGDLSGERLGQNDSLEDLCRAKGLRGRQVEVTAMVLRGFSNKLIARKLEISPETVKVYRKRINHKLGTSSSRQIFMNFFVADRGTPQDEASLAVATEPARKVSA
jgi:DNA-binding CsgD family transcriptional regulator